MTLLITLTPGEWISIITIAVIVVGSLFTLIYKTGGLVKLVEGMKPHVDKIPGMEVKVDELWRLKTTVSNSPSRLNKNGQKILKESNITEILLPFYDEIVKMVKNTNPSNAYKVQEALIDVLKGFQFREKILNQLEQSAFIAGTEVHTILFVAAIHLRDDIITKLGFSIEEIDIHDPKKNENH